MYYKKSLGQNFLIDKNIIKKISKNIDLNSNVIEIGPGKCSLTDEILKKDLFRNKNIILDQFKIILSNPYINIKDEKKYLKYFNINKKRVMTLNTI